MGCNLPAAELQRREALYAIGLKTCNTCTEPLPLEKFAIRHDGWQGLNGTCRRCGNVATLARQKLRPELGAARSRRWRQANREAWLATSRRRDVRFRWRRDGLAV
jgi:hypothetical protein